MSRKLRKGLLRLNIALGVGILFMCCYYWVTHRWTTLIPWALCLVLFVLWQFRVGSPKEEATNKRKARRY